MLKKTKSRNIKLVAFVLVAIILVLLALMLFYYENIIIIGNVAACYDNYMVVSTNRRLNSVSYPDGYQNTKYMSQMPKQLIGKVTALSR